MFSRDSRKRTTRFALEAGYSAGQVAVAGEFSGWEPLPMNRQGASLYVRDVPTSERTFEYKFLVDGLWMTDPDNPNTVPNSFGTFNSVAPRQDDAVLRR